MTYIITIRDEKDQYITQRELKNAEYRDAVEFVEWLIASPNYRRYSGLFGVIADPETGKEILV